MTIMFVFVGSRTIMLFNFSCSNFKVTRPTKWARPGPAMPSIWSKLSEPKADKYLTPPPPKKKGRRWMEKKRVVSTNVRDRSRKEGFVGVKEARLGWRVEDNIMIRAASRVDFTKLKLNKNGILSTSQSNSGA